MRYGPAEQLVSLPDGGADACGGRAPGAVGGGNGLGGSPQALAAEATAPVLAALSVDELAALQLAKTGFDRDGLSIQAEALRTLEAKLRAALATTEANRLMALSPKACSFRIGQIFTLSAFALGIGAGARSAKAISVTATG
jgi:hypothetical protein